MAAMHVVAAGTAMQSTGDCAGGEAQYSSGLPRACRHSDPAHDPVHLPSLFLCSPRHPAAPAGCAFLGCSPLAHGMTSPPDVGPCGSLLCAACKRHYTVEQILSLLPLPTACRRSHIGSHRAPSSRVLGGMAVECFANTNRCDKAEVVTIVSCAVPILASLQVKHAA